MTYAEILMLLYWDNIYQSTKDSRSPTMKYISLGGLEKTFDTSEGHLTTKYATDFMWVFEREFLKERLRHHFPTAVFFEMNFPETPTPDVSDVILIYNKLDTIDVPYFITSGTQMVKDGGGSSQPKKIIFLSEADMVLGAAALVAMNGD